MESNMTCQKVSRCLPLFAAAIAVTLSFSAGMAASSDKILTEDEITQSLLDQGYVEVIRMEMEDGLYEVKVKTKDGERQSLNVDPETGKVLGVHEDGLFSN
jgi:uncharacterized membrane protein YkoI